MKIPSRVKICGQRYTVIQDSTVHEHGDFDGKVYPERQVIYISPDSHPENQFVTLLHEVIHAIACHSGWVEVIPDFDKIGEMLATGLSHNIYQVLKDNKFLRED